MGVAEWEKKNITKIPYSPIYKFISGNLNITPVLYQASFIHKSFKEKNASYANNPAISPDPQVLLVVVGS